MSTTAYPGVGTVLKRGDGESDEGFDAVAGVFSLNISGMTREKYDKTSLDSTDGYREYEMGFRDVGDLEVGVYFSRAILDDFLADFESSDVRNWQIALPDADDTVLEFAGYVAAIPMNIVADDLIKITVTIAVTGLLTIES